MSSFFFGNEERHFLLKSQNILNYELWAPIGRTTINKLNGFEYVLAMLMMIGLYFTGLLSAELVFSGHKSEKQFFLAYCTHQLFDVLDSFYCGANIPGVACLWTLVILLLEYYFPFYLKIRLF